MKIINEISINEFGAWSGAKDTKETIIDNNKEKQFDILIEEMYPEGLSDTQLNDILWFESDWIYEMLGIKEEDEE